MNIIIFGCFYFLFTLVKTSKVEKAMIVEPYFDFNEYLDEPYMRKVPESPESMISDLLKGTFQFFTFSLKTIPGPISALSVQLCISTTLKHILKETETFDDYKLILENIARNLKRDNVVTEIFDPKAIDRLIQIFRVYNVLSNKVINENMQIFLKGLEHAVKVMKRMLKEITSMEPGSFDEFLEEFLSEPASFDDLASDFIKKLQNGMEFVLNDSLIESNGPSTLETLLIIQNMKKSIDEVGDPNFEEFSLYFDEPLISDLKSLNTNNLNTILSYSEYEIRKVHDYKMSFDYRVNTLNWMFKKPALRQLEENLKRVVNYSKNTRMTNLGIGVLLMKIFDESKSDFESTDIELISYLVQELLSKDSMIRRHCLNGRPYEFESFGDNVKITITNLIQYLRILGSEVKIDKFLRLIHDFLFDESVEKVKEVIKKYSELAKNTHYSYHFDSILDWEEVLFCSELGLTGEFELMKEYVFNHLLGIKEEIFDEFNGNPWLRNLTIESMEKLSTIGTASEKSASKDSDDDSFFGEVKTQEEKDFDEYFNTFDVFDDDIRASFSVDFRSSQETAAGNVNSDFDSLIEDDDGVHYI